MATILFTFAVAEEARPFRRRLAPHRHIHTLLTGIGPAKATQTTADTLAHLRPSAVVSCGFAGGLRPGLLPGQVLADLTEAGNLAPLLYPLRLTPARFHTSATVATTAADKQTLFARTGADAVEMESGPIRDLCRQSGIPCAIIRAISDTAEEDLPLDFNLFLDAAGNVAYRRVLATLASRPAQIPSLLRFQQRTRMAADRLAVALLAVVDTT